MYKVRTIWSTADEAILYDMATTVTSPRERKVVAMLESAEPVAAADRHALRTACLTPLRTRTSATSRALRGSAVKVSLLPVCAFLRKRRLDLGCVSLQSPDGSFSGRASYVLNVASPCMSKWTMSKKPGGFLPR